MQDLRFTREAARTLRRLDEPTRLRLRAKIDALAENPWSPSLDVVPLTGRPGVWRLRVGVWRVLFTEDGAVLAIVAVSHRREAYR